MRSRVSPKRLASSSAVWPMFRPVRGSVRPRARLMTGLRCAGRNRAAARTFAHRVRARPRSARTRTIPSLNSTGDWLMASVPPASTNSARPQAMSRAAASMACMPDPQFRCTVQAGTAFPHPRRSATRRAMLASSGPGTMQPRMTSSRSFGRKVWRARSAFPAATARSEARKGPGAPRALRKGVRAPSTMWTGLPPA